MTLTATYLGVTHSLDNGLDPAGLILLREGLDLDAWIVPPQEEPVFSQDAATKHQGLFL